MRPNRFAILLFGFWVLLCTHASFAQQRQPITEADTYEIRSVVDAQISPEGTQVVYTVGSSENGKSESTFWVVSTTGGAKPKQLLPGWQISRPRWSPNGKQIAFRSRRGDDDGIWFFSPDRGEPRFLARQRETNAKIAYAGESFAWSPDSKRIAYIHADYPDGINIQTVDDPNDPRVIDRIGYKSPRSFRDEFTNHVWVIDVETGGSPIKLTKGKFNDHAVAWSPDGNEIAFLSNREPDPDANNNSDIFVVDLNRNLRRITNTPGCEYQPAWSPNGQTIAYAATKRKMTTIDSVAEDAHLWTIEAFGAKPGRELNAAHDRRTRNPQWDPNGNFLYYLAPDRGRQLLFRIGKGGGRPAALTIQDRPAFVSSAVADRIQIGSFTISRQGPSFTLLIGSFTSPTELWTATAKDSALEIHQVTSENSEFLNGLQLADAESFTFKSFDGKQVEGWIVKPLGFDKTKTYPLILSVHGGPHNAYGYSLSPTFQLMAARGYAVLFINPRGSMGYGQEFADATYKSWGGGDYRDLMQGLDHVLAKNPWIDPNRMGVTGGSYGGFMTNWIITQTNRFKAAVSVASVSNLVSIYGTSQAGDLLHSEFGMPSPAMTEELWKWSPIRYADHARTPTLLLHGEHDHDVPISQAEEMFIALRRRGVKSVLVRYPREGHGFNEPVHRYDVMKRTVDWFNTFLKK